jgi:chemotaxis protein methyltransferase CheR
MRESEFDFIRGLVYERSRISLSRDKRELVSARLGKRLRATNLSSVGEYCRLLQTPGQEEELANLIDVISTNHTFFFRENAHFEFLRHTVVPELQASAAKERRTCCNLWSAACSSGEEPYSIAMTLTECMGTSPWKIEATDISHRILARAKAGIYRDETVERLTKQQLQSYFQRGFGPQDGNYRVKASVRDQVTFRQLNLLEGEPPFRETFHVIFCRNVMIYFDQSTQEELVTRLTRQLRPGGYLFVGHAESLTGIRHQLQNVRPAIYRRPVTPIQP